MNVWAYGYYHINWRFRWFRCQSQYTPWASNNFWHHSIIAKVTRTPDEGLKLDDDNEDDKDKGKLTRSTAKQVRSAITVLRDLIIFSKFGEEMMVSINDLNRNIKKDYDKNKKLPLISFMSKKFIMKKPTVLFFLLTNPKPPICKNVWWILRFYSASPQLRGLFH